MPLSFGVSIRYLEYMVKTLTDTKSDNIKFRTTVTNGRGWGM